MEMRWAMLIFAFLLGCVPEDTDIHIGDTAEENPAEIFVGKWWEVTEGVSYDYIDDACFMLYQFDYEGGVLMKYEGETNWSSPALWDFGEEDGIFIINEQHEAEVTRKGDRCWNVSYAFLEVTACECSLNVERVAHWIQGG
jgi:hypothetical protein